MSDQPLFLVCKQALGVKIVKQTEPCPWCGRDWSTHEELAELERYLAPSLCAAPVSEGES